MQAFRIVNSTNSVQNQSIELQNFQIKTSIRDSEVLMKGNPPNSSMSPHWNNNKPKLPELDSLPVYTIVTTKVNCGPPLSLKTRCDYLLQIIMVRKL